MLGRATKKPSARWSACIGWELLEICEVNSLQGCVLAAVLHPSFPMAILGFRLWFSKFHQRCIILGAQG